MGRCGALSAFGLILVSQNRPLSSSTLSPKVKNCGRDCELRIRVMYFDWRAYLVRSPRWDGVLQAAKKTCLQDGLST